MNKELVISASVAGLVVGIAALAAAVKRLLRLLKESVECKLPIVPHQIFEFTGPGEKCMHLEGPRFTTAFWGVKFALKDQATGEDVPLKAILFRVVASGFKKARIYTHRCVISHAGRYELTISGIREGTDLSSLGVIFTKPYRAKAMLLILGITFAGMLVIAGLVFSLLAYLNEI